MKTQALILITLIILTGCQQELKKQHSQQLTITIDSISIRPILDSIHVEDQKYRIEIESLIAKYGWESKKVQAHWAKIREKDESNLLVVEEILNKYGWLSSEQIGDIANFTLFLVIQHADQATQEKYLPMMRQAVKDGKVSPSNLALLEDGVSLGKGELQVYGSQIGTDEETGEMYVLPLIEPEKVNERRAEVGLDPIEDYVAHWNLEWNVEEYKKKLPKWIEQNKNQGKWW